MISKGWEGPSVLTGALPPLRRSRTLEGPSSLTRHQVRHPHQVVSRSHKVPSQPRPFNSPVPYPQQSSHRLHPRHGHRLSASLRFRRPASGGGSGGTSAGPGGGRRPSGAHRSSAEGDGVPAVRRAFGQCRAAVDLGASAGTGLGREEQRRRAAHAHHCKQSSAASWATTRTSPLTSSPSLASATGCRGGDIGTE